MGVCQWETIQNRTVHEMGMDLNHLEGFIFHCIAALEGSLKACQALAGHQIAIVKR